MTPTQSPEQIVRCPMCGAKNRVTDDQRARQPVCGRCKTPLAIAAAAAPAKPLTVTDATFPDVVERATLPVLVDLWAPWCGPCRMLAPAIDEVARRFAGRAVVAKLNTEENQATARRFKADAIPLMLIFKDGREVDRIVGLAPAADIAQRLEAHVG